MHEIQTLWLRGVLCLALLGSMIAALVPIQILAAQDEDGPTAGLSIYFEVAPGQYKPGGDDVIFSVPTGASLRYGLWIGHFFPAAVNLRLTMLLDYQPLPFALTPMNPDWVTPPRTDEDAPIEPPFTMETPLSLATRIGAPTVDGAHVLTFDLRLEPGETRAFVGATAPVTAGYHDLALLIVPDADASQSELGYFTTFREAVRGSVYAGADASPPALTLEPLDPAPEPVSRPLELASFADSPDSNRLLFETVAAPGETETVWLQLIPYPETPFGADPEATPDPALGNENPVALVAVFDDRVVPLNGEPFLLGTLREGHFNTIPVEIPASAEPGFHQYFVQVFPNPFTDVDAVYAARRSLFSVQPQRLTIEVKTGP